MDFKNQHLFPNQNGDFGGTLGSFPDQEEAADPVAQDDVRDLTDSTAAAPAPRRPAPAGLARVKTGPQMMQVDPDPDVSWKSWIHPKFCGFGRDDPQSMKRGDLWGPICLAQMEN